MIGIVVVSHSRVLADAAVSLAKEMLHGQDLRIVVAAGLDETTFGTDAVAILDALTAADSGDGVVVLMDLGSAMLSAEQALEWLDDEQARQRVVLCPAPLVEGLVVAAVTAASGAPADEVAAEALRALEGKQSHFAGPPPAAVEMAQAPDATELAARFTVLNRHGLHARPAARIVQQLRSVDARVRLRNVTSNSAWVPAASLSRLAGLAALNGHEVEIRAAGSQAQQAIDALLTLAAKAFGERTDAVAPPCSDGLIGSAGTAPAIPIGASPGIGIGPVWRLDTAEPALTDVPDAATDDPATDWARITEAITHTRGEIERVRARAATEVGDDEAAIFDAHLMLLDDANLLDDVRSRVFDGHAAAQAWSGAIERVAADLSALPNPYLQARAADVRAVGGQVMRSLLGDLTWRPNGTGVLVADDLTPAQAAELNPEQVAAVVLAFGSPTAHSAILARGRGIPAVVAAGRAVFDIAAGTRVAVDGTTGEVVVNPSAEVLADFHARADRLASQARHALQRATSAANTRDGVHILVGANVGSLPDARAAASAGADLAGLVRTEFLFLGRTQAPDVEEQEAMYRDIAQAFDGRRITLRTLDVGGDKPLAYVPMPVEANPFLGVRGIRLTLARPNLLADQLLAIVRVARELPVSVMFPMVSTLDELISARRMLDDAIARTGTRAPADLQVGIMVEVPATALKAAVFAPHLDFFSIGTNDLTQYALAAERGNDAVAALGDPLDPGVLQLVSAVCRGAGDRVLVAVCGELAADEWATAILVGLGVRELSVAPRTVPTVKQAVRRLDSSAAASLAAAVLGVDSAAAVRSKLQQAASGLVMPDVTRAGVPAMGGSSGHAASSAPSPGS